MGAGITSIVNAWDKEYDRGWALRRRADVSLIEKPALTSTSRDTPGVLVEWFLREFAGTIRERMNQSDDKCLALSAGCGTGRSDGVLIELGLSIVGFDISHVALRQARDRGLGAAYVQTRLSALPFRDASFTLAVCNYSSAPYLTSRLDLDLYLTELSRVTTQDTLVFVTSIGPGDSSYQSFPTLEADIPATIRADYRLGGLPTALWRPEDLIAEYKKKSFYLVTQTRSEALVEGGGKTDDAGMVFLHRS